MLDAQRLAVLAEVAHAGSIASAAQRLAFTPSAVSQQIGKLERDLGCRLLHRHARGVTLTAAGQVLLSHRSIPARPSSLLWLSKRLAEARPAAAAVVAARTEPGSWA